MYHWAGYYLIITIFYISLYYRTAFQFLDKLNYIVYIVQADFKFALSCLTVN